MAHFAELDGSNTVLRVLVVDNDVTTVDGVEVEQRGIDFLEDLLPGSGPWMQTSYNNNARGRYAGIGFTFDGGRDALIGLSPYPSWTLNDDTTDWEAPTPMPDDGKSYLWDEDTTSWVEVPTT